MDINKTIIQIDQAGGSTLEDVLNSNVAANVYGLIDPKDNKWKALYGPFDKDATVSLPPKGDIVTYDAYIDRLHCEPAGMQELPKQEKNAVWKTVTNLRRQATRKFTHAGQPGESYAPLVELQRQHLKHGDEYYRIIPSFFRLINILSESDMPFTLIFRTFGSDLESILQEWRAFVQGTHFCKPSGPILQRMRDSYREPLCGSVYRHKDEMYICYGLQVSLFSFLGPHYEETDAVKILEHLKQLPGCTSAYKTSFVDLKDHMLDYFARSNNVGGLVDYYPNWAQGAERRTGGKVFPLSQNDPQYFYAFFDDNIFIGDEHSIVDVREAEGAASIVDPEIERKYCVPVNAFKAIVDNNYFVDELGVCLKLQAQGAL
ncbi:hypothetical protein ABB37_04493 [Leptomonas pyrrhocoris]|uniref:Uncharacterized protein n=1 Tax=Leptomonas pyrrhocoris TaxID=157538 RepID=A0A0N0VFM5_LEPPY|nr:hypothetical protein ABB37_04493 [Leptomonas pyrrhocoris]KPA81151.1 hypothetical protein ABB37_04493 [Leptomonas pyrrhocoris]|eukprot:XP_015659590.1 hypothetical protein ABB37_04493 [Leptomonas pyrrhocoris]